MSINNPAIKEQHNDIYRVIILRLSVIFIIFCFALFLLLFQSDYFFNPHRYILGQVLSIGHIPLFGLLSWTILTGINIKSPKISNWPIWSYLVAFILTFGFGFLIELAQVFTPRDASVKDLIYNILGALVFLSIGILWVNKEFTEKYSKVKGFLRFVFIALVLILFVFLLKPLISKIIDENHKKKSFPMISAFETRREVARWDGGKNYLELSQEYTDEGQYSLKTILYPAQYSGISMAHPPKDWRGYDRMGFTIFNPSEKSLMIILKIFDWKHTFKYDDRFNKDIRLTPGWNRISISIKDIESAPKTRKMRMDQIGQISFFMRGLKKEQVLFFDNIRLLP